MFPPNTVGGLPRALEDIARALQGLDWDVDLLSTLDAGSVPDEGHRPSAWPAWSSWRWMPVARFRWLPEDGRTLIQHLVLGGGVGRAQSRALEAIERRLRRETYEAIIVVPLKAAPGFVALAQDLHSNVLIYSLDGLSSELRLKHWLWAPRCIARILGGRLHPALYRAAKLASIRLAVFASARWRDDAVAAGLGEAKSRVAHIGVDVPKPLALLKRAHNRLLWVGRCSREKGLHLFIDAVAELRARRPVTLTAICGDGPLDYRRSIERQVRDRGLAAYVDLKPSIPRAALGDVYAAHDVLLFQSVFKEPVALVLMEAFAAGIPVVAPAPSGPSALVKPDETCICFAAPEPRPVAQAIERALDDGELRSRVRVRAHALVSSEFSLAAMGRALDAALEDVRRS